MKPSLPLHLSPCKLVGNIVQESVQAPIQGAVWYTGRTQGDCLEYSLPAGALAGANYLTADFLIDGNTQAILTLRLFEEDTGRVFTFTFTALNQCQARMRMFMEATKQNRWRYEREAAFLKPLCGGDMIDPAKVGRMTLTLERKGPAPVRWCITPISATAEEPERLENPILPHGQIIDELGQSTLHEWPGKSRNSEEVTQRLLGQLTHAPEQKWPASFSTWGGWKEKRFDSTGFFHTVDDGSRWWLVDPEGHPFWSAGCDCVRIDCDGVYDGLEQALSWLPDREGPYKDIFSQRSENLRSINYLKANLIRAFGPDYYSRWSTIALSSLRRFGFNTVANWSDWQIAQAAGFPYVRPLSPGFPTTPKIFRDFPDVYHPAFAADAAAYARQLEETREDPALIGYFLMNEPNWGFAEQLPIEGVLLLTPSCETRTAFARWLHGKYSDRDAFAKAWNMPETTFEAVEKGLWKQIPAGARPDLEAFSSIMVEKLFGTLTDACRQVDPNHLNLGARYYTVPPRWAFEGMKCFDVFSVNGYGERVKPELGEYSREINQPVMIGEWHFGALDVGLPASGIGHVPDQAARGQAYRIYLEDAAAKPWCVGVHWFTLYDEAPIGRFDGENWNIGFMDICNRQYEPLASAARISHERLYDVASANKQPFREPPEYLPMLFC